MADRRDILVRLLGEETVSRMAGRAEKGLDRFGDSLEATEKDAQDLDRQIAEVEADLKTLAVAFARTGDAADRIDITKAMRKQQAELRKLTKSKDLLPDFSGMGAEMAGQVSVGFAAKLGPLIARAPMAGMNPAALAIGAPLAAGVAVVVGTAVAGAVVGAVGIGGVIGGIALASRDARVKAASKALGDEVGQVMGRASVSFVPETLDAIGEVRSTVRELEPDFRRAFGAASDHVEPLTRGLLNAGKNALPGVIDALERGGPVIDAIADGMERLGRSIGDSLSDLSEHADEGAHALTLLFATMDYGIQATTDLLGGMAMLYGLSEKMAAVWSGNLPLLAGLVVEEKNADAASRGLAGGLTGVMDTAVGALGGAVALSERQKILNSDMNEGIAAAGGLSAAFKLLNGDALSAREAERGYQAAIDAVTASIKTNGTSLDDNTAKGRANNQAIDDLVTSIDAKAQAVYDETLATKGQAAAETAAKGVYEAGRAQLIKNLTAILGNKDAAIALADKIMKIPKSWSTKADFHPDNAGVKRWKETLSGIPRNVFIKAHFDLINNSDVSMALRLGRLSKGGPVKGAGPKGVDSQPYLLAPGEHVLTADEVDAAGGHSGVERLRASLRGEGGVAVPSAAGAGRSGGGGGAQRVEVVLRIEGNDRGIVGALLKGIKDMGGNPAVLGIGGNW